LPALNSLKKESVDRSCVTAYTFKEESSGMSSVKPRAVGVFISVAICLQPVVAHSQGEEVLARSIALYATLASYSDTGTVVREAPGLVDRWKFRTRFRRSSPDFFFDFQGVTSQSAGSPPTRAPTGSSFG
jgi:hypothetical protein